MRAVYRLFPWDVEGDPDAVARLVDAGVERVSLAASYHAARVATPAHPAHRIVELPTSAVHSAAPFTSTPPSAGPPLPRGLGRYENARDALEEGGVSVDTWIVLNHLDGAAPNVPRVRSPFGERVGHAPCLAQPATLAFDHALLSGLLPLVGGGQVLIEALGWQGVRHGSQHDKLAGADFDDLAVEVLGFCVCDRCCAAAGVGEAEVRSLRALIDGDRPRAAFAAVERMRAGRSRSLASVREHLLDLADRLGVPDVLLAEADAGDAAGEVLVDCWGGPERALAAMTSAAAARPGARLVAHVDILQSDPAGLADTWAALAAAGATGLHIYHAGLASTRRLAAASAAVPRSGG